MSKSKHPARVKKDIILKTEEPSSSVSLFLSHEVIQKFDQNELNYIEALTHSTISHSQDTVFVNSKSTWNSRKVICIIEEISRAYAKNGKLYDGEIDDLVDDYYPSAKLNNHEKFANDWSGNPIYIKSENQKEYVESIKVSTVIVGHGSAGTGKTKLALVMGIKGLESNRFDKLMIIRPLTTVGDDLGYLPGTVDEKYGPYSSPIVEALVELLGDGNYKEMVAQKKIVFIPATFIRGANFKNAFVLVDEAQNLSRMEMLTILTRLCENTKIVITGDETQSDLKKHPREGSGLDACLKNLKELEEVSIIKFGKSDIQRSKIVSEVITAFE